VLAGGDPFFYLAEAGAIVALWIALGLGLAWWSRRAPRPMREPVARGVLAIGIGIGVVLLGLAANPLLHPLDVGATPVLTRSSSPTAWPRCSPRSPPRTRAARRRRRLVDRGGGRTARHVDAGDPRGAPGVPRLAAGPRRTSSAELYSYSAAWVVFGVALLVAGLATRSLVLRWASLVVMLAAC